MAGNVGKHRKGPDWTRIKADYLKGGTSYRDLASKHGVSLSTLGKRAGREGWDDDRQRVGDEVATELPSVVAVAILSERDLCKVAQLDDAQWLRARAKADAKASLADVAKAIHTAQQIERKALGLEGPASDTKGAVADAASSPQADPAHLPGAVIVVPGKSTDWAQLATAREGGLDTEPGGASGVPGVPG